MLSCSKTLKCQPLKLFLLDLHFCSLACLILLQHLFVCTVLAAEKVGLLVLSAVMPSSRWSSCGSRRHIRAETDKASSTAHSHKRISASLGRAFCSESCFGPAFSCLLHFPFCVFVTSQTPLRHELPGKHHFLYRVSSRLGPPDS